MQGEMDGEGLGNGGKFFLFCGYIKTLFPSSFQSTWPAVKYLGGKPKVRRALHIGFILSDYL